MIITKIIKLVFETVWSVIKLLYQMHLTLALLVGITGLICYWLDVFENQTYLILFHVALGLSVFLALYKIFRIKPKKKEKKPENEKEASNSEVQTTVTETENVVDEPKYYAVKDKPGYVMAEYADRFELYKKVKYGLKKVRVDYKEEK